MEAWLYSHTQHTVFRSICQVTLSWVPRSLEWEVLSRLVTEFKFEYCRMRTFFANPKSRGFADLGFSFPPGRVDIDHSLQSVISHTKVNKYTLSSSLLSSKFNFFNLAKLKQLWLCDESPSNFDRFEILKIQMQQKWILAGCETFLMLSSEC